MKELKLVLDGLDCANCASKIETRVGQLDDVHDSTLNFMSKILTVEHNCDDEAIIFEKINQIVKSLEPHVKVTKKNDTDECDEKEHEDVAGCSCCTHDHTDHEHKHSHNHSHSHSHDDASTDKMKLRLIAGAVIFVASFVTKGISSLSMGLAVLTYVIVGYDILFRAVKNIIKGRVLDENFLMAIASLGAMFIGDYKEAAGVMLFYQVGEYFQSVAVNKSRKQITELLNIKPEFANIKTKDGIVKTKPENVKIGDIIIVKPGEKIPLDGTVLEGSSSIDTSALTGESMPVDVEKNSTVLNGSINLSGVLTIGVTKLYKESTVAKILYLVEKAGNKKSETENFITKFARYYTPAVVGLAVLVAVIPPVILKQPFGDWIYKGLVFLVVSCPCALVLSIPLTYFSGLGCASKYGILIKGGNYLEALSNVETAVFDKTGTLTEGKFEVSEVESFNDFTKDDVLRIAAYGEYYSNHPIAESIKKAYNEEINESLISGYSELAGHGIVTDIEGKSVVLGNSKLMAKENIELPVISPKPGTILYIAVENKFAGYIVIADKIKPTATSLVKSLKALGVKNTVMLTGDNKVTADSVKAKVGLDTVYSELLPHDKVEKVEELFKSKSDSGKLIFVGDGINDAPVLVRADIGFAMGGVGSDAAIESADVVIVNDEIEKVAQSISIAKETKKIVWQNIIFSLGVKLLVMIMTIFSTVPMPLAVFADVGVALIAVLNASRILRFNAK